MHIRLFDWPDIPILHRYRRCGLFLDTALVLTRGSLLISARTVLSAAGLGGGVYTYLCNQDEGNRDPLLAQVTHKTGATFARVSFIAPDEAVMSADLLALFDQLAPAVGERGAFHILAEVDEHSQALNVLRQAGFAIFAKQRIWRLDEKAESKPGHAGWQRCSGQDTIRVRSLYTDLVPGLVQQVEPLPRQRMNGMVYYRDGALLAYVELRYGPVGVWVQPFIHPDARDFTPHLGALLRSLPGRRARPLYLCIRSYQSWLEGMLEELGAVAGVSQAVMVRHLGVARRAVQPVTLPAINGTRAEPITHMVLNPEEQDQ